LSREFEKLLREICFMIKVEGRRVLKNYPITPAQFDLLQSLYFRGPCRMTDLSLKMGIAKSTLSGLVQRLENEGYVHRGKGKDKRVYLISITEKGKSVIQSVIEKRIAFIEKISKRLGKERSEKLMDLLIRFKEEIEFCREH